MLSHKSSAIALSITLVCTGFIQAAVASDAPLQGNVEHEEHSAEASSTQAKPSKPLQGGIKDDASLHSSLKLIPASLDKKKNNPEGVIRRDSSPLDGQVDQYAGNVHRTPDLPIRDPRPAASGSITRTPHLIPPVSSYIFTPRNGLMIWDSEYSVRVVPQHERRTINVPGSESSSSVTTRSGVTTYDDEYSVAGASKATTDVIHLPGHETCVTSSRSGVSVYEPGYEVGELPTIAVPSVAAFTSRSTATSTTPGHDITSITTRSGVTSYVPGFEVSTSTSQHGSSTYDPGYQVSISTSRNGIVCWQSGYQTYEVPPGMAKETLGGAYFTRNPQTLPEGLRAIPGKLVLNRMGTFVQSETMPMEKPLVATGLLLPQLRGISSDKDLTWKQWYDRMGQAIYSRWQYAEVGPGIAHVRIEVAKNRTVNAEVVGFDPAPYAAKTEAEAQKEFCQAAVGAVDRVTPFEIPEFPAAATDVQSVTIYVDMKRTVDGAAGFTVASSPNPQKRSNVAQLKRPEDAIPPPSSLGEAAGK